MKPEDQLGQGNQSDGPNDSQQAKQREVEVKRTERRERSSTPWLWGLIAVVLICALLMWMGQIASSLADTKHMVAQNGESLHTMNGQLSGLQAQLAAIGQQVNQLQTELQGYYTAVMEAIHHHLT